jgi:hypothetical protein
MEYRKKKTKTNSDGNHATRHTSRLSKAFPGLSVLQEYKRARAMYCVRVRQHKREFIGLKLLNVVKDTNERSERVRLQRF